MIADTCITNRFYHLTPLLLSSSPPSQRLSFPALHPMSHYPYIEIRDVKKLPFDQWPRAKKSVCTITMKWMFSSRRVFAWTASKEQINDHQARFYIYYSMEWGTVNTTLKSYICNSPNQQLCHSPCVMLKDIFFLGEEPRPKLFSFLFTANIVWIWHRFFFNICSGFCHITTSKCDSLLQKLETILG